MITQWKLLGLIGRREPALHIGYTFALQRLRRRGPIANEITHLSDALSPGATDIPRSFGT